MILLHDGKRYSEFKFKLEADFEAEIIGSCKAVFGDDAIYIDAKKKIGTEALGSTIPDGFLFDMSDPENRELYLVEVELESHDFYNHIFPQITKFFAFFKNSKRQKELVEKLFSIINVDENLRDRFRDYLGEEEIFKFLNDVVDASRNILLIIDGEKPELPEITDTYSDTWGKMVRIMTIRKYVCAQDCILTMHPEFEGIEFSYEETPAEVEKKSTIYTEEYHLEGVNENVKEIYRFLKDAISSIDSSFVFNPQKYYISIKGNKNIVFMNFRKKKIRMVVMLPEEIIRSIIHSHSITSLSDPVQRFYNGPCASVDIHDLNHIEEVIELIRLMTDTAPNEVPDKAPAP